MRSDPYRDLLCDFDLIRLTAFGTFPKGEGFFAARQPLFLFPWVFLLPNPCSLIPVP